MTEIRVQITGIAEFRAALKRMPDVVKKEIGTAIHKSVLRIERNAKTEAPVNKQTGGGQLRQNIRSSMIGPLSGMVEARSPYAIFVHEGTRPHLIRPVVKKGLANRRTGQFFGKLVHHPGTKPNPFFRRAIERTRSEIEGYFRQALDKMMNALKG